MAYPPPLRARTAFLIAAMVAAITSPFATADQPSGAQSFDSITSENGVSSPSPSANMMNVAPNAVSKITPNDGNTNLQASAFYSKAWQELMVDKQYASAVDDFTKSLQLKPNSPLAFAFRGEAYANLGKTAEAKSDLNMAVQINRPGVAMAVYFSCMRSSLVMNDRDKALAYLAQAKETPSKQFPPLFRLAWFLSTYPDPQFHDPQKAVDLATQACTITNWKLPLPMDTLAVAYAASGDFDNAVQTENECLKLANASRDEQDEFQDHLDSFKAHKVPETESENAAE
jgi:tetratricopeptide (TPR) repeat protein